MTCLRFSCFSSASEVHSGTVLRLGNDRFLPKPFQPIVVLSFDCRYWGRREVDQKSLPHIYRYKNYITPPIMGTAVNYELKIGCGHKERDSRDTCKSTHSLNKQENHHGPVGFEDFTAATIKGCRHLGCDVQETHGVTSQRTAFFTTRPVCYLTFGPIRLSGNS
jgi:hypothetical protein